MRVVVTQRASTGAALGCCSMAFLLMALSCSPIHLAYAKLAVASSVSLTILPSASLMLLVSGATFAMGLPASMGGDSKILLRGLGLRAAFSARILSFSSMCFL